MTVPPGCVTFHGTYFCGWLILVTTNEDLTRLAHQRYSNESQAAWGALLAQFHAPLVVACDGGPGLNAALEILWPDTLVQLCNFHILLDVCTHLTWRPRTSVGQTLLTLTKQFGKAHTPDTAIT